MRQRITISVFITIELIVSNAVEELASRKVAIVVGKILPRN
jgi:hypothetical protein